MIWDVETAKQLARFDGLSGAVVTEEVSKGAPPVGVTVFHPDGGIIANGIGGKKEGAGVVKLWDISQQKTAAALKGHSAAITCFSFSQNGMHDVHLLLTARIRPD